MNPTTLTNDARGAARADSPNRINGVDLAALAQHVAAIEQDPAKGIVQFQATTRWAGGFRCETQPGPLVLGGETHRRDFRIVQDEPAALLGTDGGPNPQEMLMAALNACIMVGFVAGAATRGIQLQELEVESKGHLDLRGFLGLDAGVKPGYDTLNYRVHVRGNASPEMFREIHDDVRRLSPNYFNLSQPVRLVGDLVVR